MRKIDSVKIKVDHEKDIVEITFKPIESASPSTSETFGFSILQATNLVRWLEEALDPMTIVEKKL